MENRLDPVKVQEARKRVESFVYVLRYYRATERDEDRAADIELCLRALDEGREASAPFAELWRDVLADAYATEPDDAIAISVPERDGTYSPTMTFGELRALAAFHALFPEPEEKNDVR